MRLLPEQWMMHVWYRRLHSHGMVDAQKLLDVLARNYRYSTAPKLECDPPPAFKWQPYVCLSCATVYESLGQSAPYMNGCHNCGKPILLHDPVMPSCLIYDFCCSKYRWLPALMKKQMHHTLTHYYYHSIPRGLSNGLQNCAQ